MADLYKMLPSCHDGIVWTIIMHIDVRERHPLRFLLALVSGATQPVPAATGP